MDNIIISYEYNDNTFLDDTIFNEFTPLVITDFYNGTKCTCGQLKELINNSKWEQQLENTKIGKNDKNFYDNDKIGLEEHLKRLEKNLNTIINDNKKFTELFYSNSNEENQNTNRMSIRKSIVPGLDEDEFFDLLKEKLGLKIKKYYLDFNNNYEKILKEIENLIILLIS